MAHMQVGIRQKHLWVWIQPILHSTDQSGLFLAVTTRNPRRHPLRRSNSLKAPRRLCGGHSGMLEQLRQVNGIDPNRVSELSSAEPRCSFSQWLSIDLGRVVGVWVIFDKAISLFQLCGWDFLIPVPVLWEIINLFHHVGQRHLRRCILKKY